MDFRPVTVSRTGIFRRTVDSSTFNRNTMTRMTPVTVPRTEIFGGKTYTGGTTLRLPTGRNVLPPTGGEMPTSTLATASVFGGTSGGLGAATTPVAPTMLSGFGSSVSKAGVSIMNTFGSLVPLAIKVIIAVIVIKIILWLIKRR